MVNSPMIWTWNGQEIDIRNLDQRQIYAIKHTLSKSTKKWFGKSAEEWNNAIDPILKQHEHMNIKHIVHQQNTRREQSAIGIAEAVIQMFSKSKNKINYNDRSRKQGSKINRVKSVIHRNTVGITA